MSNLSPSRKERGKHAWRRETSLTSNLSPSRKERGEKHMAEGD